MPRQRSKTLSGALKASQKSNPPTQDEHEEDERLDSEDEREDVGEKDDDELEMERLVLGDAGGFLAGLDDGEEEEEEVDEEYGQDGEERDLEADVGLGGGEEDMEGVDDADLFFLDAAPSAVNGGSLIQGPGSEDGRSQGDAPAWEDSDDDRLMVSLAGKSQLRKLRISEGEDIVTGREYTKRLRRQFLRLNPAPEWANASERPAKRRRRSSASSASSALSDEMDVDNAELSTLPLARLLQSSGSLTRIIPSGKQTKLRPEVLAIQRTRDIPMTQAFPITSLQFHPQYPVLLSSGPASTLYLHHIAPTALPTPNPLLTSVHIRSTPLHTSAFLPTNGDKIFFSGRRRYFHTWDLESGTIQKVTRIYGQKDEQKSMEKFKLSPCGRYMALVGSAKKGGGIVNILDANTSQWIAAARIESRGGLADFAWWSDGEGLTLAGRGGEIGEWNMQSRSFITLWQDEGAVGTSVLTLGGRSGHSQLGGDRWVVIGSSSGIVNIYDRRPWVQKGEILIPVRPEPTKILMQLVTGTSCLEISPDGQLMAMASRGKRDALRLVHLPSCTVYRNWPTSQTPLGRISAVAFSPESSMLAVANEQGKIRLWEIRA